MSGAKFKVEFEGFDEVMNRLKKLNGDMRGTTEKALKETHSIVTNKAQAAIAPHRRTGRTEASLYRAGDVRWSGETAFVWTGFPIHEGGLPSIFLMYGTPRMKKDQQLYNAFFGAATKKQVLSSQEDIFYEAIRKLGG